MFRRIPRLSMKRVLLVALPVLVLACAVLLVVMLRRPEEPGIQFRNWDGGGVVSIDEREIIDLFHLDLSAYQFPADFPLTVDHGMVYFKFPFNGKKLLVKGDFSLSDACAPSPDLKSLLCASPLDAQVRDLPEDQQGAAVSALVDHIVDHRRFFIITPGTPLIYTIPEGACQECKFTSRTSCEWSTGNRIYCVNGYGTAWGVALFDLRSGSDIDLPQDGADMETNSSFSKGYIYPQNVGPPRLLEVYDFDNHPAYRGVIEDWVADEDAIASIAYCGDKSLCVHKLEFDDHGLKATREVVLGELRSEDSKDNVGETPEDILDRLWSAGYATSRIIETRDEYLVSSYGKSVHSFKVTTASEASVGVP